MGIKNKLVKLRRFTSNKLRFVYGWRTHASLALVIGGLIPALWLLLARPAIGAPPCPCNVFSSNPSVSTDTDAGGLNVGMKFRADIDGYITGVRFFKHPSMTGVHTGNIWDAVGNNLGTVTFSGETASGWQEMALGTPVQVTAGTQYVVSLFHANGVYAYTLNGFTSEIVNFPLRAPQDGGPYGGNGVANLSNTNTFPNTTFSPANYWVDVAFKSNITATPPTVTSTTPTNAATNVSAGETVKAVFDQYMDGGSFTTNSFTVKDASNNPVSGTVSYNNSTKTASFVASNGFTTGETYTATIEGGTGSVATNIDGVALASDHSWSFTISPTNPCPCSLKDLSNPAGAGTFDDTGTLELGVKIKPSANGFITAVRFYKPITSTVSSRTVKVWDASGNNLSTATSSNESEYGWQEVKLSSPVAVNQNQLYIVSYYSSDGVYMSSIGGLNSTISNGHLTAFADTNAENAATGSGNRNGVFRQDASAYPNAGTTNGSYYWVDAVFNTSSTVSDPLSIKVTQPNTNAIGVQRDKQIAATFNHALNGATVTNTTARLFDSNNTQVSGSASYDSASYAVKFTPSSNLTYGETYTMRLGASIADTNGATLGSEYSWSFTVGSALSTDVNQGPGGPILVVTTSGSPHSKYYAEILRTEGLNYFEVKDISTVSAGVLANFDAVVLAEMSLTQPQADMFSTWVNSGGNLVAMRPDKKLASLLGLTDAGTTRANQYLQIDTGSAPGQGITSDTMQFHGTADNYTLNGATALATLFSDASTTTSNPAVVKKDASNGGQAAAFTFDLAKSVIATHQGNLAWAGQDRDGLTPKRSNDLFFGARAGDIQPDWVDLNKIHIPQADEQQRLLANMLTEFTRDRKPLPRFWYLPHDTKGALVLAGDDHGVGDADGTKARLNDWLNESPTNCSIDDWQCVRASHYIQSNSALTNDWAATFYRHGFELGDHVNMGGGCNDYTSYSQLDASYGTSFLTWYAKYTSIPQQKTHRYHCYVWSDYDSVPRVEFNRGMRYNLDYVAFPLSWLNNRTPILTGSGMNMRFTDTSGNMIDSYQGVTNLDNVTSNSTAVANLLTSPATNGYYGLFGSHYDMTDTYHRTLFNGAKAANVSIISSAQALTWLDGRNSSNFSGLSGSNGQYSFTVNAAVGATGLRAMLPINDAGGTLTSLKFGDDTISYQTQTIKGVSYAVFTANPGPYTATYSDYNPDPGGGGDTGGGQSGNTGNQSTSSGSSGQVAGRSSGIGGNTTTSSTQDETVATNDETSKQNQNNSQSNNSTNPTPGDDGQEPADDAPPSTDPFWLIIGGILLLLVLLGLVWWLILFRRRKHESGQDLPPHYFGS